MTTVIWRPVKTRVTIVWVYHRPSQCGWSGCK